MNNPLQDPIKNPLKNFYEEFWVPVFGRILYFFSSIIEGDKPKGQQTFDLRTKKDERSS